jgi:predicted Fe-Mo cluster-binding NifX family protein
MKIAVVSDDSKTIASHFGRAAGFIIFEIEKGQVINREFRANGFTHHHLAGAVHQPHEHQPHSHAGILTALEDCEAVISCGMGQRMFVDFQSVGKEVFITDVSDAETAVHKYLKGELPNYPDRGCQHHH